jgi:hypothetical protein
MGVPFIHFIIAFTLPGCKSSRPPQPQAVRPAPGPLPSSIGFQKYPAGKKFAGIDRFFSRIFPMGASAGNDREKDIDRRIKVKVHPLRFTAAGLIFKAMIIFKKLNFRHGFTSLVNGIATFSSLGRTGWHGFFEPDSQPFCMTQSKTVK